MIRLPCETRRPRSIRRTCGPHSRHHRVHHHHVWWLHRPLSKCSRSSASDSRIIFQMCFKMVVLPAPRKPERTIRRVGIVLYCIVLYWIVLYWFEAAPLPQQISWLGVTEFNLGPCSLCLMMRKSRRSFFCHTIYRPYLIVPYLTFLDFSPKVELISELYLRLQKKSGAPVESSRNAL